MSKKKKDDDEAVKNQLGTPEVTPELQGDPEGDVEKTKNGIVIGEPLDIRPKSLPLVVKVPESASSAQKEYAKVLNGYAYKNPKKWAEKKAVLVRRLESLAKEEVSVDEDKSLSLNKSRVSFSFIKDDKGNEFFANPLAALEE